MATQKKPNILVLWGDDIGIWNISHFSRGMMGYRTPNIDRVAEEGVTFTDYYAQQSCTAGRACFICGQNPIRTGLTKVGMQLDPANPQEAAARGAGYQPHACGPGDLPLPDVSTASYPSRTESRMRG